MFGVTVPPRAPVQMTSMSSQSSQTNPVYTQSATVPIRNNLFWKAALPLVLVRMHI